MTDSPSPANPFLSALDAEGSNLLAAGRSAWASAEAELVSLGEAVLAEVGKAISTAIADLVGGESIEEIETAVLNLLEADVQTTLASFTSGALQALIVFATAAL